jgi:hypothetical protein
MRDCHADGDCAAGFWCASIRDAHPICGAPPSKLHGLCSPQCLSTVGCTNAFGPGATCGSDGYCNPACVMSGTATYSQGPWCTQRNECRQRKTCDPCQSDLDCAVPGHHCRAMPMGTDKFCTPDCASDADCSDGFACTSNACIPRYGSCKGTGKFCEPCHVDADCEAGKYCSRESSGVERVCAAPLGSVPCTSDAQCPVSPSGVHGKCMDASTNSSPGDGVYHTCWLPFVLAADRFVCWPENTNAACYTGADCISKQCMGAMPAMQMPGACK